MKKVLGIAVVGLLAAELASATNALDVTAGAALLGTSNGLEVTCRDILDGVTANVFVQSDHPASEKHYRARFAIRLDQLALNSGKAIRIAAISDDADDNHLVVFMKKSTGNQWQARLWYKTDTVALSAGPQIFWADASVFPQTATRILEVEWTASTGPGANNGTAHIRRFSDAGAQIGIGSLANLDTDTKEISFFRAGILGGTGNATNCSGTGDYHFDEFESYR